MFSGISYDKENAQLTVNWAKGGSTTYDGVSQKTFEEMDNAESAGKYYNANIKGQYHVAGTPQPEFSNVPPSNESF